MARTIGEVPGVMQEQQWVGAATLDRDVVVGQLERILSSDDFDASPRSRAFFSFIVEETLAGRQEDLTQSVIATRVFERRDDFNPTVDPIVRIQAGRLRRSLERYYLMAGAADAVRIELPRGTYVPLTRWTHPSEDSAREAPAIGRTLDADGWPSVIVGVFDAESAELAAAAEWIQEEMCIEMGRYGDVSVVLQRDLDQLGAAGFGQGDFALSGHLSSSESGLRVHARLVDCRNARQVWAEEYRAPPNPVRRLYEETARRIAARVASEQGAVAHQLWAQQRKTPPAELQPYGAILRSYQFFFNREPADFLPAHEALRRIVRERPECALAWVQLARLCSANYAFEIASAPASIDEAITLAQNGVHLDPSSQRGRVVLAGALLIKGELAAGREEAEKAYELNPGSFVYLEWIGWLLALLGEWDHGIALIRRATLRNPNAATVTQFALWANHMRLGYYELAYRTALLFQDATFFWRPLMRASSLGHLGRRAEAKHEVAELLRRKPNFHSRGRVLIRRYLKFPDLEACVVEGLAKAGLKLD
jgi:adenylate cyclase